MTIRKASGHPHIPLELLQESTRSGPLPKTTPIP